MQTTDTIFAVATAPGRAGVAVIRISGPQALCALPAFGFAAAPAPRHAHYHSFVHSGELIDHGLILYFPAPHSFTGEEVIEFQLHGGFAILKRMQAELGALPHFRLAEPGEFARRAFLNGKMDLTAAEGLADLIDAETEAQRAQAAAIMAGHAARFYDGLRQRILEPLAHLEAYIDFPEEEIPESVRGEIDTAIAALVKEIAAHLKEDRGGEKLREGFTVVLLGAPNAGKSSLLNALAHREVAIVSPEAGTTRDLIEVHLDLHGLPAVLIDTAGLRSGGESIENEGMRRARTRAAEADLKLALFDTGVKIDPETSEMVDNRTLILFTKSDRTTPLPDHPFSTHSPAPLSISAMSGEGIGVLTEMIYEALRDRIPENQNRLIVRARHRLHLQKALEQLQRAQGQSILELQCECLRLAALELAVITGRIDVEDLLAVIFSQFCIGK